MEDTTLAAAVDAAVPRKTRQAWANFIRQTPVLLGRQGIFDGSGRLFGYELYYRTPNKAAAHVDRWSAMRQDRATGHVIDVSFTGPGIASVAGRNKVFVNFTRSYLVGDLPITMPPDKVVIEVVESVPADAEVIAGVASLCRRGYRIAIDDFVGTDSQVRLLPYASYVKIDVRDLVAGGPALVDQATSYGARLVAERIEDDATLNRCRMMGFRLFQGNLLDPTVVLDRSAVLPAQRCG